MQDNPIVAAAIEAAFDMGKDLTLNEVVMVLNDYFNPQSRHVMHPADFITKYFSLDGHENLEYG